MIEGRDLKGRDRSGNGDPLVLVKAFNQKKSTKYFKQVVSATFDQLLFFEFEMKDDEFMKGKVKISCSDSHFFFGSFKFPPFF